MLRRRKKRSSASNHPGLGLPKGETRADRKTRLHAVIVAHIKRIREQVFERDVICRCCAGKRNAYFPDEMHELIPRSATRGRPVEERFSLVNCVRLCNLCHNDVTEKRLVIVFHAAGAEGCLVFREAA